VSKKSLLRLEAGSPAEGRESERANEEEQMIPASGTKEDNQTVWQSLGAGGFHAVLASEEICGPSIMVSEFLYR
jgi:hypothetical protein